MWLLCKFTYSQLYKLHCNYVRITLWSRLLYHITDFPNAYSHAHYTCSNTWTNMQFNFKLNVSKAKRIVVKENKKKIRKVLQLVWLHWLTTPNDAVKNWNKIESLKRSTIKNNKSIFDTKRVLSGFPEFWCLENVGGPASHISLYFFFMFFLIG